MGEMPEAWRNLLCDPQTSGGLLLAVTPEAEADVQATAAEFGITLTAIGELVTARGGRFSFRRHRQQQAAGGLRIAQQVTPRFRHFAH